MPGRGAKLRRRARLRQERLDGIENTRDSRYASIRKETERIEQEQRMKVFETGEGQFIIRDNGFKYITNAYHANEYLAFAAADQEPDKSFSAYYNSLPADGRYLIIKEKTA